MEKKFGAGASISVFAEEHSNGPQEEDGYGERGPGLQWGAARARVARAFWKDFDFRLTIRYTDMNSIDNLSNMKQKCHT